MLLGLNTFEWIVIILLIVILIAIIIVISGLSSQRLIVRSEIDDDGTVTRNSLERLAADIKEAIKANSNADIYIKLEQSSEVLAAIATHMKLGLPTDEIKILDLDDGIKQKLIEAGQVGEKIASLVWWLDMRGPGGIREIPGIGEKELKKIEKALTDYRENHVFASA